jgi:hypothetical protein
MVEAVRDCLVTGYEKLMAGLELPDPGDCHVLAAAIRANAQAIVTFNLKDFPPNVLAQYDIELKHPDDFVLDTIDLAEGSVVQVITEQAAQSHTSILQLLSRLHGQRLVQSAARLRSLWPPKV